MNEYRRAAIAHNITSNLGVEFGAAWRIAACMCKRSFPTRTAAEDHGRNWGQRAYRCEVCGRWHLSAHPDRIDGGDADVIFEDVEER